MLHADLRIRGANPAFYRTFRMNPQDSVDHEFFMIGARQLDVPALRRSLEQVAATGASFDDLEVEQDFRDIGRKIMLCNARRIDLPHSREPLILLAIEDVTARRQAEQQLQTLNEDLERRVAERTAELAASNKELEAFSYSVSHDLRAPLRGIDGFSRILLEEYASQLPPEAQRYLQLVRTHTQQMGRLVDDLLAFSRLGRQSLQKRAVDLKAVVSDAIDDLRAEQEGREIQLKVAELPVCLSDPMLLRQVFINLLSNALKFTRTRNVAVIEVGTRPMDGAAGKHCYFVRDNGVGFDMTYSTKLFGVFQRLHRAEDYEGTGVGLAIVQRIIHRHGGRVWAEGQPDAGATFYFTLEGNEH